MPFRHVNQDTKHKQYAFQTLPGLQAYLSPLVPGSAVEVAGPPCAALH